MATVNGVNSPDANSLSITNFLEKSGYIIKQVAVELNGNILPKAKYDNTIISENDCLEVVSFVGGG